MLNGLWLGFFLVATVSALSRWLLGGDATVFASMVESLFAMAKLSVEVMVILFGTLTLWLVFLRIAERAGLVDWLARLLGPLFARLMPEVPRGHPGRFVVGGLHAAAQTLGPGGAGLPDSRCAAVGRRHGLAGRAVGDRAGGTVVAHGQPDAVRLDSAISAARRAEESAGVRSFCCFPALLAATLQGSTETTFYVLAVYFGSVGIQRARHAVGCALLADLSGVLASIGVCYWFFG